MLYHFLNMQFHPRQILNLKRHLENKKGKNNDDQAMLKIIDIILDPKQPSLWINPEIKDFYEFTLDDIKLIDYEHLGKIDMPVAV